VGTLLAQDGVFRNDDAVTCRQRCEQTEGCNCYTFDPSHDETCWLKSGACDQFSEGEQTAHMLSGACHEERPMFDLPGSTQPDDGGRLAASAVKQSQQTSRQTCSTVTRRDLVGAKALEDATGGVFTNATASSCRSRCEGLRACKCYAFDPRRNSTCWLKEDRCDGGYDASPEAGDMVSGACRPGGPLRDWPLRAAGAEAGPLERFRVVAGARKGTVGLLSHHGTYVAAQSDGFVSVDGGGVGDWETFEEVWLPNGRVAFKSFHGGFLAPAEGGTVLASARGSGDQESFEVREHAEDGSISLMTADGSFLSAARLGVAANAELRADGELAGSWATFILRVKQQEGRTLLPDSAWLGETVTLQSHLGTYVGVGPDGDVTVSAQEKDVGRCEEFTLVDGGEDGIALQTCKGTFLGAGPSGSVASDVEEPGERDHFLIDIVDVKVFFSALDLPVSKLGRLTNENLKWSNLSILDPNLVPHKPPQPVVLKTTHGGYLFPLEHAKRGSDKLMPSNATRVTQAVIFTRTCEDSGLLPIANQSACQAAARSIGLVKSKADVDVKIVEDAGVPEGCYVENLTRFRLGTNPFKQWHWGVAQERRHNAESHLCWRLPQVCHARADGACARDLLQ